MNHLHFDSITPIRRARASNPATSHAAAEKVGKFAASHAGRILQAIEDIDFDDWFTGDGPGHANQNTIADYSGLSVAAVSKRLKEMQDAGLIAVEQRDGADWVVDGQRCWRAV